MPDYKNMFAKPAAVVGQTTNTDTVASLLEWRNDLSEKVRQHVDLIDKIIRADVDVITEVNVTITALIGEVTAFAERSNSLWTKVISGKPDPFEMQSKVHVTIDGAEAYLKKNGKVDPFKRQEVNQLVQQVDYLIEHLDKACSELEKKKNSIGDDFLRDAANRRIQTLTSQQQLIATGAQQIKQLAMDIATRPSEVSDYLNGRLPILKRMCLDVLSGQASISELRKKA